MKPNELWENYARNGLTEIGKVDFLAALAEYGEAVRAEARKVCNANIAPVASRSEFEAGRNNGCHDCAAAIEKMKLP
jgi:hypothetical protein